MVLIRTVTLSIFAFLVTAGAFLSSGVALAGTRIVDIRVIGTSLLVGLSDGRSLTGAALVGAVLTIADARGRQIRVRIDGAKRDPQDASGKRWLYQLMTRESESGEWHNFCGPGPEGHRLGFPVSGTITGDGSFVLSKVQLNFTCTAGAVAKCIRLGYEPWAATDQGVSLLGHFKACLRMVRADYCGDGLPHTRDGTLINLYDRLGIQISETSPDLSFEAAWGPHGAVCVRKTRIGELWTLDELKKSCGKRLAGKVGPGCTRSAAEALPGALIFNESGNAP